jgi:hypothetical protein
MFDLDIDPPICPSSISAPPKWGCFAPQPGGLGYLFADTRRLLGALLAQRLVALAGAPFLKGDGLGVFGSGPGAPASGAATLGPGVVPAQQTEATFLALGGCGQPCVKAGQVAAATVAVQDCLAPSLPCLRAPT